MRFEVDVLEQWHRKGIVYAETLEEAVDKVVNEDEGIFWEDPEFLAEDSDNPEYLSLYQYKKTKLGEPAEQVVRYVGRGTCLSCGASFGKPDEDCPTCMMDLYRPKKTQE